MDDDLLPRRTDDPLAALLKQDLDPLSRAELEERIALLTGEVERTRAKLASAGSIMSDADALFSRK